MKTPEKQAARTATLADPRRGAAPVRDGQADGGWNASTEQATRYPATHVEFIERCHAAGKRHPAPLLRMQSHAEVAPLHQGVSRVRRVRSGQRHTLGIIFHGAT